MGKRKAIRVYIAGPMTNGQGNGYLMDSIHKAIRVYMELVRGGHVPICPQLSVFCEFLCPGVVPYEKWLELDFAHIRDCECVLRIPGASVGADKECAYAMSLGKPVFEGLNTFRRTHKDFILGSPSA